MCTGITAFCTPLHSSANPVLPFIWRRNVTEHKNFGSKTSGDHHVNINEICININIIIPPDWQSKYWYQQVSILTSSVTISQMKPTHAHTGSACLSIFDVVEWSWMIGCPKNSPISVWPLPTIYPNRSISTPEGNLQFASDLGPLTGDQRISQTLSYQEISWQIRRLSALCYRMRTCVYLPVSASVNTYCYFHTLKLWHSNWTST